MAGLSSHLCPPIAYWANCLAHHGMQSWSQSSSDNLETSEDILRRLRGQHLSQTQSIIESLGSTGAQWTVNFIENCLCDCQVQLIACKTLLIHVVQSCACNIASSLCLLVDPSLDMRYVHAAKGHALALLCENPQSGYLYN